MSTLLHIIFGLIIFFLVIAALSAGVLCIISFLNKKELRKPPVIPMLNRVGSQWDDGYTTYIAGLKYRATHHDAGGFYGWVEKEPDNEYDHRAVAIYNEHGRKLGYIPAKELYDFRKWSDGNPVPCTGFIFVEEGVVRGRIKALLPCSNDFLNRSFASYHDWVRENFGEKYVPNTPRPLFPTSASAT